MMLRVVLVVLVGVAAAATSLARVGDTHAVVLYVPRQCLLDPKVASS
jgi:hypothetical protein